MRRSFVFNLIKGFACLAIAFFAMANKPCFADDRLLIGSFNNEDKPVQLVVANPNSPMSSVLTTAANQTVSSHSGNQYYNYLSGGYLLDYFSYCGLDFFVNHSAKWFYDNNLFVNYSGSFDGSSTVNLTFILTRDNFVSQPVEWRTLENTGDQVFYDNTFYFYRPYRFGIFSPAWDTAFGSSSSFVSDKQYFYFPSSSWDGLSSGTAYSYNNNSVIGSLPFQVVRTYSSLNDFNISGLIESFIDSSYKFLCLQFEFTLTQYNDSVSPLFGYSYNCCRYRLGYPLSASFYEYGLNSDSFYLYARSGGWNYNWITFQTIHRNDSLATAFPFYAISGALAYEGDFVVNSTPTPTPFPTFEPWDPNNPAGGSTPTPIPSGFGGLTPSPVPSVSPPVATVTPINIFYNPEISNAGDVWGYVKSIFDDFNSFFLDNQFIRFASSIMNTIYYFDSRFKYFVIPVFVCFIVFIMGRFRRK